MFRYHIPQLRPHRGDDGGDVRDGDDLLHLPRGHGRGDDVRGLRVHARVLIRAHAHLRRDGLRAHESMWQK